MILLTAYAEIETALEAMKLGAFDCLMKPCSAGHLCDRVREAMGKKGYGKKPRWAASKR